MLEARGGALGRPQQFVCSLSVGIEGQGVADDPSETHVGLGGSGDDTYRV